MLLIFSYDVEMVGSKITTACRTKTCLLGVGDVIRNPLKASILAAQVELHRLALASWERLAIRDVKVPVQSPTDGAKRVLGNLQEGR